MTLGEPEPAPGGRLWKVSGSGTITLSGQSLPVETGAGSEAPAYRLHLLGQHMPGWLFEDGQIPFRGKPDIWGAEDEHSLRRLGAGVAMQPISHRLGGQLALWRHGGAVVARAMFVALPQDACIDVREVQAGEMRLRATGLVAGWHVRLQAAEATQAAAVSPGGDVEFAFSIAGEAPASLQLRLSNPAAGSELVLIAPWPARRGRIVTPEGRLLSRECAMAVGGLGGWRAVTPPERGGALLLRSGGAEIGVPISGEIRLAAAEPLVRLMLALGGLDAEARLNLVVNGAESPRLLLRRYDSSATLEKGVFISGTELWRLHAVPLAPPGEVRRLDGVSGRFDVAGWLGDTAALWLIQARAASGEAARPAIWSADPPSFSTRDVRIAGYAEEWRRLLAAPGDPEWVARWQVIRAVHGGGDAGALDQVQALGTTPAAAVALLFQVAEPDLASVLALEGEAPIWWPVLPVADWASGVATVEARNRAALHSVGFEAGQAAGMTGEILQRRAGAILALRPELQGHLGAAFVANRIPPVALASHAPGGLLPLATPAAGQRFRELVQQAARRETQPPENTAGLPSARRSHAAGFPDHLRALLDAPLVAAEIATGLMPYPDKTTLIRLLALRQADPVWFDAALPVSMQLYSQDARA